MILVKKQKDYVEKYLETTKNKQPFKIDLKNGVILDMIYDDEVKNYRAWMTEENVCVGIWDMEFMYKCLLEDYDEFEILV